MRMSRMTNWRMEVHEYDVTIPISIDNNNSHFIPIPIPMRLIFIVHGAYHKRNKQPIAKWVGVGSVELAEILRDAKTQGRSE